MLPAALLLHQEQEQAGIPSTGMELPSMQKQLRLSKYCHRALGQPSFKKFEGPQTHFAQDSIKSVQGNEIILAVAVVCFAYCLNKLLQNCSSLPSAGLQSQEQSSCVALSKATFMVLISVLWCRLHTTISKLCFSLHGNV